MPNTHPTAGCLLGVAVGDALGLPYEGLSARRARKMLGAPSRYRLLFGRGMVSDDTEHSCMVAQALIAAGGDVDVFRKKLAWGLRWWFLGLPAGIGLATLRAMVRLWFGFNSDKSGVYSAGNGPAMRAGIFGATIDDRVQLRRFVRACTRITHTDPKAEYGAFAVALAAQMARHSAGVTGEAYLSALTDVLGQDAQELLILVRAASDSAKGGQSTTAFAQAMGLSKGVSGYMYHSVPVAIHAWLAHPADFRSAVTAAIECGGDTDTIAAIVGSIVGAAVGKEGIPAEWRANLTDWPRSVAWMEKLAQQMDRTITSGKAEKPIGLPVLGIALRNVFFIPLVLFHGFRRLLPPY